jgi:hypothetical protein
MNARVRGAAVGLLAVSGLFAASAGPAGAEAEFHGLVLEVRADTCGAEPGTCTGSVVIGYCEAGILNVRVEPGATVIRRSGQTVGLRDLRYGDKVLAELQSPLPPEEVPGYVRDGGVATVIDVQ